MVVIIVSFLFMQRSYSDLADARRIAATCLSRLRHGGKVVRVRRRYAARRAISSSSSDDANPGITSPGGPPALFTPWSTTWIKLAGSDDVSEVLSASSGRAARGTGPAL